MCQKHSVSGYPTLKIFRKGQLSGDYDGPRDAEGIVKYMRGQVSLFDNAKICAECGVVNDFG